MSTNHEVISPLREPVQHVFVLGIQPLLVAANYSPTIPTIANFSPTVGSSIYPSTPIQFDVTDVDGVQSVVVLSLFPDGTYEVVFDSASFAKPYSSASTVSPITDGLRFVLRRTEGWPASPSIRVLATDNLSAITPL